MTPTRRRVIAFLSLGVIVAAGLVVHLALTSSAATDIAGDALYTVAVYAGVVVVFPRVRPMVVGLIAGGWSVAVELLQATGIPLDLAERFRPIVLVLGTGFDPRDLLVYACAAIVAGVADAATGRSLSRGE